MISTPRSTPSSPPTSSTTSARVLDLCQQAIEKGLDDDSKKFADDLYTGTLIDRAAMLVDGDLRRATSPIRSGGGCAPSRCAISTRSWPAIPASAART